MEPLEEAVPERPRAGRDRHRGLRRAPRRATTSAGPSRSRDEVLEHVTVDAARRGPHPRRGLSRRRQDRAGARALALDRLRSSRACSARPTCCRPTSSAPQIYNQREARFEFRPGPIFANVVLVDEVNRASPKTQSGLLECMQERHVTVDATSHELARPFLVFATQNPVEYEGTYPLPEAQVDRFMVRLSLGYPDAAAEAGHARRPRVARPRARPRAGRRPRRDRRGRRDRAPRARLARAARLHRRAAAAHARRTTASSSAPRRAPA